MITLIEMKTQTNNIKLNVLEERVCNMIKTNNADHAQILKKIEEIDKKLDNQFVSQVEFRPIKAIVMGMVTIALIAVAGAIIKLVVL